MQNEILKAEETKSCPFAKSVCGKERCTFWGGEKCSLASIPDVASKLSALTDTMNKINATLIEANKELDFIGRGV